ncbi:MAG: copper amine oxidase N-terminal domain-containing protein [Firmicutes bacterium]|nr:copper amine oxidase N-terminal domain-containing protein [Bacillota bacterium]
MKRTLAIFAATMMMSATCFAQGISVNLNGENIEFTNQEPVVEEGRTLVPLRGVFDKMGYSIDWIADTKTAQLKKDGVDISVMIGEDCIYKNGEEIKIDVPAKIINGSTMIPLRAVADAGGVEILWDDTTKTVGIVDMQNYEMGYIGGSVNAADADEAAFIKNYEEVTKEYNKIAEKYLALNNEMQSGNFDIAARLDEVKTISGEMYEISEKTKTEVEKLDAPEKFKELKEATVEYMDSMHEITGLTKDFIEGNIDPSDYKTKLQSAGVRGMQTEVRYKDALKSVTQ